MGEVRVHLEDVGVLPLQGPPEPGDVSGAEPALPVPVQHVHPGLPLGYRLGQLARAVRGIVVHDQDLEPRVLAQHLGHEVRDVRSLVVRRDDDERPLRHPASA